MPRRKMSNLSIKSRSAKRTSLSRKRETAAEREARQEKNRLCTTKARTSESDEQRYVRLTKNRISNAERRAVAKAQRSNFYEAAFNYDPAVHYADDTRVSIGAMTTECIHCKARKWPGETLALCCSGGKVKLPAVPQPPEPLKKLLSSTDQDSKHFQNEIRQYNAALQMTSFGATKDITEPGFMQTFAIQGKFEAPIEKSELNSIQSSQHSVETRKLQKVTVENDANLKQQTKATTRAQRNQLISVNTSNEVNSKLCKNNSEILLHPQSVVPPVQEKRILVVPNHQTAVMSNLFSMWKAGRLCDSYISNGTTTIMVHKMVLGAVCPKLLPILHHSSKGSFPKVTFPSSVSKEGLLAFAEYMYNGVVDLNEEILVQLKTIGERLSMKDFEQLCCNELNKAKTKDILSAVVEPLLAEPCSLSGLFPSRTQGDINKIQNSMLINLFRNNYSNSNNMQPGVLVSTGSSTSNVRSEEIMTTNQIIDIQSEVEPEIESATNHNSLQLKIEPYSPDENQHSFQEELYMDIGNTSSNNNHHLPPATSATSGNINTDNDLTVTYSDNQYKNDLNMVSSDNINISDAPQSEETCLSQHTENCDEDTDNQKELQLISITSVAGNINEDNLSNNSDLVETSSTMPTNTKQLQTSNSKPYPISLFSVNNGDYTAV